MNYVYKVALSFAGEDKAFAEAVAEGYIQPKNIADRVCSELGIRADAPRALADGTMKRFTDWHENKM